MLSGVKRWLLLIALVACNDTSPQSAEHTALEAKQKAVDEARKAADEAQRQLEQAKREAAEAWKAADQARAEEAAANAEHEEMQKKLEEVHAEAQQTLKDTDKTLADLAVLRGKLTKKLDQAKRDKDTAGIAKYTKELDDVDASAARIKKLKAEIESAPK